MTPLPVYLDRDGVINRNRRYYVRGIDDFIPLPGAIQSIVRLYRAGHPVVVVTNQSCIGRGLCDEDSVRAVNYHLSELVSTAGGVLSGIYYCPHLPDDGCSCRKPATGMVDSAVRDLDLPSGGFIVGDAVSDMELGRNAGLRTIMVMTGRGREQLELIESTGLPGPWRVAEDISEAVDIILSLNGLR
ncbi:MAG: hypothetical protein AVO35_03995 [Candidatus Aegiribacteria sp. MLS_C]|nr:MAG: hypothetical protein AVO35_03995 [Candidatus Aegiribacteria sp. MLS_C]